MTSLSPADTRQNKQPGYEALTLLLVDRYCCYDGTLACSGYVAICMLHCTALAARANGEEKKKRKSKITCRVALIYFDPCQRLLRLLLDVQSRPVTSNERVSVGFGH